MMIELLLQERSSAADLLTDLQYSISLLERSFSEWYALGGGQLVGMVPRAKRHSPRFRPIHRGRNDPNSTLLSRSPRADVYLRGSLVYRYSKIRSESDLHQRFRELVLWYSFPHPNLVCPRQSQLVFGQGKIKRVIHVVEYFPRTLQTAMYCGEIFSYEFILEVGRALVSVLIHLHARGVVSGGCHSDQIYLRNHVPVFSPSYHSTQRHYLPPECLFGEPYSKSADVWSLGVLLLSLSAGTDVFPQDSSVPDLLVSIAHTIGPPPCGYHFTPQYEQCILEGKNRSTSKQEVGGGADARLKVLSVVSSCLKWVERERASASDLGEMLGLVRALHPPPPVIFTDPYEQKQIKSLCPEGGEEKVKEILNRFRRDGLTCTVSEVASLVTRARRYFKGSGGGGAVSPSELYHLLILLENRLF